MSSPVYEIPPQGGDGADTEASAYMPMTFGANPDNTLPRLQAAANISGVTFYTSDAMGQYWPNILGRPAQEALQPGAALDDTYTRLAERLAEEPYRARHEYNLGLGHSLGGLLLGGMHRHSDGRLWDGVELADAVNTHAPEGRKGYLRFIGYQVMDLVQQRLRHQPSVTLPEYDASVRPYPVPDEPVPPYQRFRNVARAMRSSDAREGILALADTAGLPIHYISYTHGLSGPEAAVDSFAEQLTVRRQAALRDRRHQPVRQPVANPAGNLTDQLGIRVSEEDCWHSGLLDPIRTAVQVGKTLELVKAARG